MEIHKIIEEDLKTIYPNNGIMKLSDIGEEKKEEYLSIYSLYRKLFTEYMIEKLNLKKYDDMISKSELEFMKTEEKHMDIYQYLSKNELKYFYIRNNTYIEKLTEEEKRYLQEKIEKEDYELKEEEKEFIEKTYKKVIFEDILKNGAKRIILYGPDAKRFLSPNDGIVIGFRYNEFGENGLSDEEWGKQHRKQLEYISEMTWNMWREYKEKQLEVNIIKYGEMSIIKREK